MIGVKLIKIATFYLVIGILMGMYMSMSETFQLRPVHTHINLLGWATMGLAGIYYVLFPKAGSTVLARIHFWLHNIGLPLMMFGLGFLMYGNEALHILIPFGATLTTISIILFAWNIFQHVKADDQSTISKAS